MTRPGRQPAGTPPLTVAFTFQPAPATTGGQPTCYACTADPASGPPCPRCDGTGQEPAP